MNLLAILALVEKYGPDAVNLFNQITGYIKSNNGTVSAADIALMEAFGAKKASDYLAAAGGPPPAPPA